MTPQYCQIYRSDISNLCDKVVSVQSADSYLRIRSDIRGYREQGNVILTLLWLNKILS
jgi:hypothetical protein